MARLSVLDLAPITQGGSAAQALERVVRVAQKAETLGYERFWLAEHHNMPGIASSATAVVVGHIAANTSSIRVGAGGIMLPNHSPLVVAEQFGTLATLFPGRVDLGLGRAPGADHPTLRALRRHTAAGVDSFPNEVVELLGYLGEAKADALVRAIPGTGTRVPVWILGSSTFGANLAAQLGLPFAFASHFAPAMLTAALSIYRTRFRPSVWSERPYVGLGVNVVTADTEQEAQYALSSLQQAFVALRLGTPGQLQPPVHNYLESLGSAAGALLQEVLSCSWAGTVASVRRGLSAFLANTGADELIVSTPVFDEQVCLRSMELTAEAMAPVPR